jgi:Lar family restriction alleviation protein
VVGVKEAVELLLVILIISVLIVACTTTPIDVDTMEEKLCAVLCCHVNLPRRSSGMYDLARETKEKVDEAMREREVWRNMQANESRPCPFCGFKHSTFLGGKINAATYGEQPHVACMNCGARGPSAETFDRAVEWWNKRTETPEVYRRGNL